MGNEYRWSSLSATADAESWAALVTVGHVARAHGLAGMVVVAAESDAAGDRFRQGATLQAKAGEVMRELVVEHASPFQDRWLVKFEGVGDRTAAESLRGAELRVAAETLPPLPDDVFYHHALVDCEVVTTLGTIVGRVTRVEGSAGQSVLVVDDGTDDVLIPLAKALCPEIDPARRRIVVDPPAGLLELNRQLRVGREEQERL